MEGAIPPTPEIPNNGEITGEITPDELRRIEEGDQQDMGNRDTLFSTRFQILFLPPDIRPQPDTGFSNIWSQPFMADPGTGQAIFNIIESYFAVCGRLDPLGPAGPAFQKGQICFAEDRQQVNLAANLIPRVVNTTLANARIGFKRSAPSAAAGSFGINNGLWNEDQFPSAFIGIGMTLPNMGAEEVVTVYSFTAKSLQDYVVTPHRAYYLAIATGEEQIGQCVDINDHS